MISIFLQPKKHTAKQKFSVGFFALALLLQTAVTPFTLYAEGNGNGGDDSHKIAICHIPQGNPENMQTIEVDEHSVTLEAHLKHGDSIGACAVLPPPPLPPAENLPPVITVLGENPAQIVVGGTYTDPGATASDPEDGNITQNIVSTGTVDTQTVGTYIIVYNVADSQNLSAETKTRTINVVSGDGGGGTPPTQCADGVENDGDGLVDFPADPGCANADDNDEFDGGPTLTLLGASTISITQGGSFIDPGAVASDPEDGDLTGDIVRTGTVDTQTVGAYTLTYNVNDEDGHAATPVTRTVNVVSPGGGGAPVPPAGGGTRQGGGSGGDGSGGSGGGTPPQCADGSDNDADGKADYPNDGGCESSQDNDESGGDSTQTETPGGGGNSGGGAPVPPASGGTGQGGSPAPISPGNSGGQGGGVVAGAATTSAMSPGEVLGESSCFYLRDYLRLGMDNDPAEVLKLQTFLRDFEGFTQLEATGFFGLETDEAVRAFQDRYREDVLLPWDLKENTGYVYYTTRKKINEIYCQRVFPLDQTQLSEIEAFRVLISGLNAAKYDESGIASVEAKSEVGKENTESDALLKDMTVGRVFGTTTPAGVFSDDMRGILTEDAGVSRDNSEHAVAAASEGFSKGPLFSWQTIVYAAALFLLTFLLSGVFIRRFLFAA